MSRGGRVRGPFAEGNGDFLYGGRRPDHDPTYIAALPEGGQEVALNDPGGVAVPVLTKASTQFDPHGAVIGQDQHHDPIIALRIPDTPVVEKRGRKGLHR